MNHPFRSVHLRVFHPLRRLGQRGQVLMLFGVIYVAIGASLVITSTDPANQVIYKEILELVPALEFWGGIWIAVGLTAIITAFWPTGRDAWGFAAVTFWTLCWAFQSFFSIPVFGVLRVLIGLSVYLALAGISMIVAGMRGPDDD